MEGSAPVLHSRPQAFPTPIQPITELSTSYSCQVEGRLPSSWDCHTTSDLGTSSTLGAAWILQGLICCVQASLESSMSLVLMMELSLLSPWRGMHFGCILYRMTPTTSSLKALESYGQLEWVSSWNVYVSYSILDHSFNLAHIEGICFTLRN